MCVWGDEKWLTYCCSFLPRIGQINSHLHWFAKVKTGQSSVWKCPLKFQRGKIIEFTSLVVSYRQKDTKILITMNGNL